MRNAAVKARRLGVVTLGCVAISAALWLADQRRLSPEGTIGALPLAPASRAPYHAVLLARRDVCESLLDFAHVFERPGRLRVTLEGTVNERSSSRLRAALRLPSTAMLILYDSARVVRMAMPLPASVEAADRLVSWIARPSA